MGREGEGGEGGRGGGEGGRGGGEGGSESFQMGLAEVVWMNLLKLSLDKCHGKFRMRPHAISMYVVLRV